MLAALLPLCIAKLARRTNSTVIISDACLTGWAATPVTVPQAEVEALGEVPERSRARVLLHVG